MYFFYYILFSYLLINGIYLYNKYFNRSISKKILELLDYNVDIINIDNLPNKLVIIGSHTSIYDFIIGTLFYYAYLHNKYEAHILMKKEFESLCSPLLMFFDKKFKLISVSSKKKTEIGLTDQICNTLEKKDNYLLFLAPEGTRKCTENLRSGYWYISKKLNIDVCYLGIDYETKSIMLENNRKVSDTWENEQDEFIKSCKKYVPLYPERCYWTRNFYGK